ncbi:hypothetical protein LUD75_14250 [Epilithonimonas sp. JDS]|uniref:hypothetical protein n=1 Tax=Epilithonimonas sp. JDS TaxID=2902797 RepID=UPI001E64053A|nr:hypothetical protein [Epilithonimonas sp. JDS]MCD9855883.1 hypothetical protein [Epilithonimonas sp. JDS]
MKKLIFRYWIVNALIAFALFIIYRVVISTSDSGDESFFEWFLAILEILLSLGFSLVLLGGMLLSSLLLFLNLFEKVRNNFYLSMLTFLGIPMIGIIYIIWMIFMTVDWSGENSIGFLTTFLIFAAVYSLFNLIQFLRFRKRISSALPNSMDV